MTIESVFDPAFAPYGKVLEGYDTAALLETLQKVTPVPEGVEYVPSQPELEALPPVWPQAHSANIIQRARNRANAFFIFSFLSFF